MNNLNIVWTAVATIGFGLASFLAAWQNSVAWSISLGLSAVASATLASREK
jgi:hypothetical protein